MHYPWEENYQRGYEWWLMVEAKKVGGARTVSQAKEVGGAPTVGQAKKVGGAHTVSQAKAI